MMLAKILLSKIPEQKINSIQSIAICYCLIVHFGLLPSKGVTFGYYQIMKSFLIDICRNYHQTRESRQELMKDKSLQTKNNNKMKMHELFFKKTFQSYATKHLVATRKYTSRADARRLTSASCESTTSLATSLRHVSCVLDVDCDAVTV